MNSNNKNKKNKKRVFVIVDYPNIGETYGSFSGSSPGNAADKVLTLLAEKIDLKNTDEKNFIFFTIREITSNNNQNNKIKTKEYSYIGTRVELYEPIKLKNGRIIKYRNNMTRVTDDKMDVYNIYEKKSSSNKK
jgi:hypothetical protein